MSAAIPAGVTGEDSDGWLEPPTGPAPEAGEETQQVKVTPAEINDLVDKIVEAIAQLEKTAADIIHEPGLNITPGERFGYTILIGYAIKKYWKASPEILLLGAAALAIIGAWTTKLVIIAQKRAREGKPLFGKRPPPPPSPRSEPQIAQFVPITEEAEQRVQKETYGSGTAD